MSIENCEKIQSNVTDIEVKDYQYDWVIKSYGKLYRKCSGNIWSPVISFDDDAEIEWRLELDVRLEKSNFIVMYLIKGRTQSKNICVLVSLLNTNGDVLKFSAEKTLSRDLREFTRIGCIAVEDKTDENILLPNDTLIVRFKVTYLNIISNPTCTAYEKSKTSQLDTLEKLFESEKFTDAKIVVGERVFKVHKCILATGSEYFSAMFEADAKERITNEVKIIDVRYEVIQEVLRFIYTGKVDNIDTLKMDIFIAADKYMIEDLKILSEKELIRDIRKDNFVDMLKFSEKYNSKNLKDAALNFFKIHRKDIIASEEYKEFVKSLPADAVILLFEQLA